MEVFRLLRQACLIGLCACWAWGQEPGPGRQVANGAANIGVGAAKGAGHLVRGTAKGVGNLVTLHPIDAAVSMGKGAGQAGKDVTVGTAKGSYKITKGIVRGIKRLF
jgi:hypothetical protein